MADLRLDQIPTDFVLRSRGRNRFIWTYDLGYNVTNGDLYATRVQLAPFFDPKTERIEIAKVGQQGISISISRSGT